MEPFLGKFRLAKIRIYLIGKPSVELLLKAFFCFSGSAPDRPVSVVDGLPTSPSSVKIRCCGVAPTDWYFSSLLLLLLRCLLRNVESPPKKRSKKYRQIPLCVFISARENGSQESEECYMGIFFGWRNSIDKDCCRYKQFFDLYLL